MLNRAAFNTKRFDVPEKPTTIDIREALQELIEAAAPELILTVPESFTASGAFDGVISVGIYTYRESLVIPFNLQRLIDIISGSGYEYVYDHFVSKPALPFVLIARQTTENMFADNRVYAKANRWHVILCTEKKETATEKALEAIFDENEICWEVFDEFYNKEDRLYQIIYEFSEMED
jgi:hypothetical protein